MIQVGIVGLGFMAAMHLKAYRRLTGVEVTAICNPSGRHLDGDLSAVAGNVGDPTGLRLDMSRVRAHRDLAALLADPDLQLIDLCSPTMAHADQAVAALEAGKHVLVEKPMARTSAEARRMVAAATAASRHLMPAMCLRFWPEWRWVREAMADGRYGRVLGARFRRVAEPPAWGHGHFHDGGRSGGALLDLHVHDVDFIHHCFGRPQRVFATGYSKFSGAIDHVVAQYEVEGGAMVHAEGGWAMTPGFGFNMSYTVNFERATVDYDLARGPEEALRVFAVGEAPRAVKTGGSDGYEGEIAHLLEAIRHGTAPTVVTAADGLAALETCEAEERSIRSGQPEVPGAT